MGVAKAPLCNTRWKRRTAVQVVNQVLTTLGLTKHPDKTFVGRVENGVDLLGDHLRPGCLTVTRKTVAQFVARVRRLDEQESRGATLACRLGAYVQRWVRAGITADTPAAWRRGSTDGGSSTRL